MTQTVDIAEHLFDGSVSHMSCAGCGHSEGWRTISEYRRLGWVRLVTPVSNYPICPRCQTGEIR